MESTVKLMPVMKWIFYIMRTERTVQVDGSFNPHHHSWVAQQFASKVMTSSQTPGAIQIFPAGKGPARIYESLYNL